MRILISAYAFSPYRGSEAAVGWNICKELASLCDVTVLCGDVAKEREVWHDLERWRCEGTVVPALHVEYVAPGKVMMLLERLHKLPGLWALYYLAYNLWQRKAYRRALELHRAKPFDLAHHLTMIGFREPGYMWKLPIPFVWGPVGGSPNEPIPFMSVYSASAKVNVILRNAINWLQKRLLSRPKSAARKASKIWAVTDADMELIHKVWKCDCEQMTESAATQDIPGKVREYRLGETLDVVWSGTHTYGKAMPILIHAMEKIRIACPFARIRVSVLGRGGETGKWKHLADKCNVGDAFEWIGYLPREEALKIMDRAHVLAFTSVKEGTPHVVLEALSLGLPVICHDACGMGHVVTEDCGIKVPMTNPGTSIDGFAKTLIDVIDGKKDLRLLSAGALERAASITWEAKAKRIFSAYGSVVGKRADG